MHHSRNICKITYPSLLFPQLCGKHRSEGWGLLVCCSICNYLYIFRKSSYSEFLSQWIANSSHPSTRSILYINFLFLSTNTRTFYQRVLQNRDTRIVTEAELIYLRRDVCAGRTRPPRECWIRFNFLIKVVAGAIAVWISLNLYLGSQLQPRLRLRPSQYSGFT